jgi:hypothetical protein
LSRETWTAFKYNFDREQYGKPSLDVRQAPFGAQLELWWTYFRWQGLRDAHGEHALAQASLAIVFLILGLLGGVVQWQRDRRTFSFIAPLVFTMSVLLIYYLNFKYTYSQAPQLGDTVDREVRDRDYFFIWSFSLWSVWAALGLVFLWQTLASLETGLRVRRPGTRAPTPDAGGWLVTSPVLAVALVPLFGNWRPANHAGDTTTRDFAADLLNSVEPYGMIVTAGDNDTFPLWYAQQVEGIRRDVVILCESLMNTDWYPRQLVRAPVHEYDAAKGPAIYRDRTWKKPVGPPVNMTLDDVDKLPPYVEVTSPQEFIAGDVHATIAPRVLAKSDILVLRAIKDNTGRPLYFSRTTGTYGDSFGLGPYLLTQGLARKMLPRVATAGVDTVVVPNQGALDVPRSVALWNEVFKGPAALVKKGDWPDPASLTVPVSYVIAGLTLGTALEAQGRQALASKILGDTDLVIRATRTEDLFGGSRGQTP